MERPLHESGDIVQVLNCGGVYSGYSNLFSLTDSMEYKKDWAEGQSPSTLALYVVEKVVMHENGREVICIIRDIDTKKIYLMHDTISNGRPNIA